jgi:hypothetical protein
VDRSEDVLVKKVSRWLGGVNPHSVHGKSTPVPAMTVFQSFQRESESLTHENLSNVAVGVSIRRV